MGFPIEQHSTHPRNTDLLGLELTKGNNHMISKIYESMQVYGPLAVGQKLEQS